MRKNKNNIELDEKTIMDVLDLSTGSYEAPDKFKELLSKDELEMFFKYNNLLSLLPAAAKLQSPSSNVKENLLKKINSIKVDEKGS